MGQCGRAGSWVSRQAHWAALDVLRFCSAGRLVSAKGFRGWKFILDVQPAPLSREESDTEGTAQWVAQWNAIASPWRHSKSDGLFNKLKNYQHLWNWGIIELTQWCMICETDLLFGVQVHLHLFSGKHYTLPWIILPFECFKCACLSYLYHEIPSFENGSYLK